MEGGGTRGKVTEFSDDARRRMRKVLLATPWQRYTMPKNSHLARGAFMSATYHEQWPTTAEGLQAHRIAFKKRLRRRWPGVQDLWRLEEQKRGAPHWHIVAVFRQPLKRAEFRRWFARAWNEVAGYGSREHYMLHRRRRGQDGAACEFLYGDGRKLQCYLSKYVSKADGGNGGHEWGRRWGRSSDWPQETGALFTISLADAVELARRVRRWGRGSRYLASWQWWKSGLLYGAGFDLLRGMRFQLAPTSDPPF
jgi:hypothetical protein